MTNPLFELADPPPLKRSKTLREIDAAAKPRWSRYRPANRKACDECVVVLHENRGVGTHPRSAKWRLTIDGRTLYICHDHAELWRKDLGK